MMSRKGHYRPHFDERMQTPSQDRYSRINDFSEGGSRQRSYPRERRDDNNGNGRGQLTERRDRSREQLREPRDGRNHNSIDRRRARDQVVSRSANRQTERSDERDGGEHSEYPRHLTSNRNCNYGDESLGPSQSSSRSGQSNAIERTNREQPQRIESRGEQEKPIFDRGLARKDHKITQILELQPENIKSKRGTSGLPVELVTNYFQIEKKRSWPLYLYRVDFSPEVLSIKFATYLVHMAMEMRGPFLFDGTMLYLTAELMELEFQLPVERNKKGSGENKVTVTMKLIGLVSKHTYQYLHVWSLIYRKCIQAAGMQLIGRNHYDPSGAILAKEANREFKLELWPGFITAIHQHERGTLLCVEVSTKVVRTETVFDVYQQCRYRGNDYQNSFKSRVVGMIVLTTYNNKTYKISDVAFNESPNSTFTQKNDVEISFIDYYNEKYRVSIQNLHQPMLMIKSSERQVRAGQDDFILLVPELCKLTGFDDSMRTQHKLMRWINGYTKLNPTQRMETSKKLVQVMRQSNVCKDFFFEPAVQPVTVIGRCLDTVEIKLGNEKRYAVGDWSQQFRDNQMFLSVTLKNWAIICPFYKREFAGEVSLKLTRVARGMSYEINRPHIHMINGNRSTDYENGLTAAVRNDPQLIVCVLERADERIYGQIKNFCNKYGKPSQVLVYKKNLSMSIATKVAIQINAKLGGVPWMIVVPFKELMTIGFSVYNKGGKSYTAMVATMDLQIKQEQKYYSAVSQHDRGQAFSNNISLQVSQAVREFLNEHGTLPHKILIYRDGLGDGQLPYAKKIEVESILSTLTPAYRDRMVPSVVPLTFVVVSKRINTRFFVKNGGGCVNPKPGTIVDNDITLPERQEFFLASQSAGSSCVSPTNYNVLHNVNMEIDHLQRFTYRMTHMYYNWSSPVAVPAVCKYAHKLAFMTANYDIQLPTGDLQKSLYFI